MNRLIIHVLCEQDPESCCHLKLEGVPAFYPQGAAVGLPLCLAERGGNASSSIGLVCPMGDWTTVVVAEQCVGSGRRTHLKMTLVPLLLSLCFPAACCTSKS